MRYSAIYVPVVGKPIAKMCGAASYAKFLNNSPSFNCKALADVEAETLFMAVGLHMSSHWRYVKTECFLGRVLHRYTEVVNNVEHHHVWVETQREEVRILARNSVKSMEVGV